MDMLPGSTPGSLHSRAPNRKWWKLHGFHAPIFNPCVREQDGSKEVEHPDHH